MLSEGTKLVEDAEEPRELNDKTMKELREMAELVEDVEEPRELNDKTVKELREMAKLRGLEGYSSLTKAELIEVLG